MESYNYKYYNIMINGLLYDVYKTDYLIIINRGDSSVLIIIYLSRSISIDK